MTEFFGGNWPALAAVAVVVLVLAWWLLRRSARPAPRERRPDVLDAGAAPAQRNHALIDSAPAVSTAYAIPPAAGTLGGVAEVIAVAAQQEVDAARAAALAASPAEPVPDSLAGDDLTRIKGVGPKLSTLLAALGVTRFAQIAGWSEADQAAIDAQLGAFAGRPQRDQWIEQARLLAAGDTAGYESRFGKL